MKIGRALLAFALLAFIASCGTKGSLECPKGTTEMPNGTCRKPPPETS